ncbi:hypothetical protein C8R44DRAFT_343602 [Mycena epipterygia]|nr:hypothetical protein C8R44DRAFT_343602 [Mycena epipterygia]
MSSPPSCPSPLPRRASAPFTRPWTRSSKSSPPSTSPWTPTTSTFAGNTRLFPTRSTPSSPHFPTTAPRASRRRFHPAFRGRIAPPSVPSLCLLFFCSARSHTPPSNASSASPRKRSFSRSQPSSPRCKDQIVLECLRRCSQQRLPTHRLERILATSSWCPHLLHLQVQPSIASNSWSTKLRKTTPLWSKKSPKKALPNHEFADQIALGYLPKRRQQRFVFSCVLPSTHNVFRLPARRLVRGLERLPVTSSYPPPPHPLARPSIASCRCPHCNALQFLGCLHLRRRRNLSPS